MEGGRERERGGKEGGKMEGGRKDPVLCRNNETN